MVPANSRQSPVIPGPELVQLGLRTPLVRPGDHACPDPFALRHRPGCAVGSFGRWCGPLQADHRLLQALGHGVQAV
ncbi:hypothetical protein GCM10010464_68440 [Pseudonocardia yunnanensis]